MKTQTTLKSVFTVTALAIASCALTALAGPEVPVKGSFQTKFAMTSPPPVVGLLVEGLGQVSHLGITKCFTDNEKVDFTQGGKMTGTMTFTAANGDKLVAEMEALTVLDFINDRVEYSGTLKFAGGTGRFANATGKANMRGGATPIAGPTGTGWFSFVGSVSSPGSAKR
jgi:hypothetical protein